MEFKSIGKKLTIKLPKCGDERNIIENYSIEEMKLEEDVDKKIINTPTGDFFCAHFGAESEEIECLLCFTRQIVSNECIKQNCQTATE